MRLNELPPRSKKVLGDIVGSANEETGLFTSNRWFGLLASNFGVSMI
jgi:hypothetical protein